MTPKIHIEYNRFLDPIFIGYTKAQPQWKDIEVPAKETVDAQIAMYKEEWKKLGEIILKAIQGVTGLAFTRSLIDVYVVSLNSRSFSRPIVMKARYTPVEFINVITHEFIHCLFTDNCKTVNDVILVPHPNYTASKHIVLHAILKYVYLDVLKSPENLKVNKDISDKAKSGYDEAWQVVEAGNYMQIIEDFKTRHLIKKSA